MKKLKRMLRKIRLRRFCSQFKNPKTNYAQSKMKSWKECYETYIWRDFAANSRTLKQILHNLKWKAERNVKKHTFEEILQRFVFEIGGFWVKIKFGLRGLNEAKEGTQECFKNQSHQPYKIENTCFSWVR